MIFIAGVIEELSASFEDVDLICEQLFSALDSQRASDDLQMEVGYYSITLFLLLLFFSLNMLLSFAVVATQLIITIFIIIDSTFWVWSNSTSNIFQIFVLCWFLDIRVMP